MAAAISADAIRISILDPNALLVVAQVQGPANVCTNQISGDYAVTDIGSQQINAMSVVAGNHVSFILITNTISVSSNSGISSTLPGGHAVISVSEVLSAGNVCSNKVPCDNCVIRT